MTPQDKTVARETFRRLQAEAMALSLSQQIMLKAAYTGVMTFDKLPEPLQMMFARVGYSGGGK